MRRLLLLLTLSAFGQAPAIFTQFSPTVVGMTVGAAHCYMWSHLPGPWPIEVACYDSGIVQQIQVQALGRSMIGSYPTVNGDYITWLVTPNGMANYYQMTGQPKGGLEIYHEGSF